MHSRLDENHLRIADPALKDQFNGVLKSGFYRLRFPEPLEALFLEHQITNPNNFKINSIFLLISYCLFACLALIQLNGATLQHFMPTYLAAGSCLGSILGLSHIKKTQPYFQWYTGFFSVLALVLVLSLHSNNVNTQLDYWAQAACIYCIIGIYSLLRLRFHVATIACHLAGCIHLLSLHNFQQQNLTNFEMYFLFTNLIGMSICYIIEHKERAMFMHRLLMDIERLEQQRMHANLEKISREDALTGLANRRSIDEQLTQEWRRCLRNNKPLSVILLDIDYFKQFNDTYGHQAGDECLVKLAQALKKETSRTGEMVGRYGGEEFILIYPGSDAKKIQVSLQRIRERIHALNIVHEGSKSSHIVTASMGAATTLPVQSLHPEKLVNAADQMLYKAKGEGRDCWFTTQVSHCEPQPSQLTILS